MKINEEVLKVWGQILKKLPKAQLILQDTVESPLRVTTILEMLEGLKLPMKRIYVRKGKNDYLGSYGDVDIMLDTFPYAGAASAATALYMGVPIVTLEGTTHAGRLGASILTAARQTEWIAADTRAYERIAAGLAEDIAAVRSGRSALRTALEKSPLMDVSSYTDNVWSAIESAWAKYGDAKQ